MEESRGGALPDLYQIPGPGVQDVASGLTPVPPSRLERLKQALKQLVAWQPYEDVSFTLAPKSLLLFSKSNSLRKLCIQTVKWPAFDVFMLLVIIANCLTLAMDTNRPLFGETSLGQGLKVANYIFIALFATEAALKIIALGFLFDSNMYLRDGWNVLDFFVVCVSFLEFTALGANGTAIRSIRVLRPLRTITRIPQMKLIVMTLIRSLPMMVDVLVLAAFYFAIFGVTTVQLYAGRLLGRCGAPDFSSASQDAITGELTGVTYIVDDSMNTDVCSAPLIRNVVWSNATGVPMPISGVYNNHGQGHVCPWSPGPPDMDSPNPYGLWCTPLGNPDIDEGGERNFDTIFLAWLNVFQTVTISDWVFIMYDCQDAVSWWVWLLHVTMVIFGNFFIIALALAVLYLFFVKDREAQAKAVQDAKARQEVQDNMQKRRFTKREPKAPKQPPTDKAAGAKAELSDDDEDDPAEEYFAAAKSQSVALASKSSGSGMGISSLANGKSSRLNSPSARLGAEMQDSSFTRLARPLRKSRDLGGAVPVAEATDATQQNGKHPREHDTRGNGTGPARQPQSDQGAAHDVPVHHNHRLRRNLHRLVNSRRFELTCTAVIILNAIAMALLWYNMPEKLDDATTIANYCFTIFFVLEMTFKLVGLGVGKYSSEGMNVFDGVVTIAGLVEMIVSLSPAAGSLGSYLSVLRAFRLLRVFRLARSWKSLNRIIKVLIASVAAVSWLSALLVLFIFIWSLLGSQFFGYKLAVCSAVEGSFQTCPPGLDVLADCPAVWDCWLPCNSSLVGTWFAVEGSPYGDQAFCEQFPRNFDLNSLDTDSSWPVYLAQVGDADNPLSNFDNIYGSILSIFQLLTLDNWADMMHVNMNRISPISSLFFIGVIVLGCYMLLNLFLAILLDNLGQISEKNVGNSSRAGSLAGSQRSDSDGPSKQGDGKETDELKDRQPQADSFDSSVQNELPIRKKVEPRLKKIQTLNSSFWVPQHQTGAPTTSVAAARKLLIANLNQQEREESGTMIGTGVERSPLAGASRPSSQCNEPPSLIASSQQAEQLPASQLPPATGVSTPGLVNEGALMRPTPSERVDQLAPMLRPSQLAPLGVGIRAESVNGSNQTGSRVPGTHLPPLVPRIQGQGEVLMHEPPVLSGLSPAVRQNAEAGIASLLRSQVQPPPAPAPPAPAPPAPKLTCSEHDCDLPGTYIATPERANQATHEHSPALSVRSSMSEHFSGGDRTRVSGNGSEESPTVLLSVQRTGMMADATNGQSVAGSEPSGILGRESMPTRVGSRQALTVDGTQRPRTAPRVQFGGKDDATVAACERTAPESSGFAPRPALQAPVASSRSRRSSYTLLKAGELPVATSDLSTHAAQRSFVSRCASIMTAPMVMDGLMDDNQPAFRVRDFLHGNSLFIFSSRNPIRMLCAQIVTNKWFEQTILFLIVVSSIQLALDGQDVDPDGPLSRALYVLDVFFCIVFGLEMVFKVIVLGLLFNGRGSYLRSPWNILDALIVAVQVVVLVVVAVVGSSTYSWLRAFRALRALRPLRAASRVEGIKIVVSAVLRAIPAVGDVMLVGLLFYFIFSVLSVNLLMGGMFFCGGPDGSLLNAAYMLPQGATINKTWCEQGTVTLNSSYYHDSIGQAVPEWTMNVTWSAPFMRFDNVPQAVWTLFQMASLEGWSDVMHSAQAVVGPEQQPVNNANPYMGLLFVVFIVVGAYFMLNLVIGVSIDKFNQMKEEAGGSPLLTEAQSQWLNIQKLLTATHLSQRWSPPPQRWRRAVYAVTHGSPVFDNAMICVIVANILTMCMVHADQNKQWDAALRLANVVFTAIFFMEMLAKWTAVGVEHYFSDNWNRFDFVVVVFSVLGVILDYNTPQQLTFLPLLRIMRVARIFRLIPKARGLRLMLTTLLWSLPALINVGSMLFMFMFMYAIMGMNLFGNIKFQENINRHANFRSFPVAMLVLFRCITGENWDYLMQDCMVKEDCVLVRQDVNVTLSDGSVQLLVSGSYLDPVNNADAISGAPDWMLEDQCSIAPAASVIYFCTFMLLCSYLLLQLVIAVVLDNIQSQYAMEEMVIHQEHIWAFIDTWEVLDSKGEGLIGAHELTALLEAVPPPLGVRGLDFTPKRVLDMVMTVEVPLHKMRVHFLETLHALAGGVAGAELPEQEEFTIHNRLVERLPKDAASAKYSAGHYYCALYVKAAIKGFLARRMIAPLWDALKDEEADASRRAGGSGPHALSTNKIMHRRPTLTAQQRNSILAGVGAASMAKASSPETTPQ